jgi:hypothetical protein
MSRETKIGNNQPCPCGSGQKFKRCCKGSVDWTKLLELPGSTFARHLTLRGKNLAFRNNILGLLEGNAPSPDVSREDFKRAFTPDVVQQVHLAIPDLWPDLDDYERCLSKEKDTVTAIYTGTYEPEAIFSAVTRHALYSERIILVDPFMDPRGVRDEFNPLLHPDEHRANTIKYAYLWLVLSPWIEAGIVNFIRPLHDFVPGLFEELHRAEDEKVKAHPELEVAIEEHTNVLMNAASPTDNSIGEYHFLSNPDEYFREMFAKIPQNERVGTLQDFLSWIKTRRANHPYYVDRLPGQRAELLMQTSGASYELAKRMCALTGSHMITDLPPRWKEIELDRAKTVPDENWEPFAKALQHAPFRVLKNIRLDDALRLRSESRLEHMRLFFRKVWISCRQPDQFSRENAVNLAAELDERVAEAEAEWKKIDQDLVKWVTGTGASVTAAAFAGFLPAAAAATVGAAGTLIHSKLKRIAFKERYPAGFFLGPKRVWH